MLHKAIPAGDVHTVANWEVADASALNALVPVSGDNGKIAWRQDNNSLYLLTDYTGPTWSFLGSGAVPGTHGTSHQSGGSDAIKLDDLAAPDDNTDLNASTTAHGLLLKATAPSAGLVNVVGIANGETAYTNKALFDATNPAALGSAAPGSATVAARRDHVHDLPDHGTLSGLTDDDHTLYLLKSGLREWDEQAGDPSTPASTKWKLYFKSGGAYIIDDAGVVTGPLSTGGGDVATDAIWDAAGDLAVGTGVNTAAKLTMGSALQVLRVNAAGTALEYAAPSGGSGSLTIARWSALDGQPPAANFATIDTRNSRRVLDFDATTDESMLFQEVCPEGATLTNGISAFVEVKFTSATSGAAIIEGSFERGNTDSDSDSFGTVKFASAAANGTSGISTVVQIDFDAGEIDGILEGENFYFKLSRDANGTNGTDDAAGDMELVSIHLVGRP